MLRNPDTLPAGDTIIEDAALEPFFITTTQAGGYTVYERVVRGKDNKAYLKTVSYPSTFNNALRTVAKEKLNSGENLKYESISDYVYKWESIVKSIETATKMTM